MIKKRYLLWLFLSIASVTFLELTVASVHESRVEGKARQELWKPAEAPKTREEARRLEKEAQQREKEAQEKLSEAKEPEEIARQKMLLEKARFDFDTADRTLDQYDIIEDPRQSAEFKKLARENLEELSKEIQDKISKYSQALAAEGTTITPPPSSPPPEEPVKAPADQAEDIRVELGEQVFDKKYKTPQEKLEAINKIQATVRTYGIEDPGISQRLSELLTAPNVVEYRVNAAKTPEEKYSIIREVLFKLRTRSLNSRDAYVRENNVLKEINNLVDALGPQFKNVTEDITNRQQEIETFLKERPNNYKATELGARLHLSDKIPSDKILALDQGTLQKAMGEFLKTGEVNKDLALKKLNSVLHDVKITMEDYRLTDGPYEKLYNRVNDYIKTYKPAEPQPPAQRGTALQLVHDTLDTFQAAVDKATAAQSGILDSAAVTLQKAGEKIENYSDMIATVPESVENATDLAGAVNKNSNVERFKKGGVTKKGMELVAGKNTVDALSRALKSVEGAEKLLKDPTTKQIVNNVGILGNVLHKVGSVVKSAGEYVEDLNTATESEVRELSPDPTKQVEEKNVYLTQIETALTNIEEARAQVQPNAEAVPPTVKEKIKTFFNSIVKNIKNIFNKPKGIQERLTETSKKYDAARREYRKFLEVEKNASPKVIQEAIDKKKSDPKQSFLEKNMTNAAQEYTKVVQDYVNVLKGVQTSVDIALNAGEYLSVPNDFNVDVLREKGELAKNINDLFAAKNARLDYLAAIQEASESSLQQIKDLAAETPVDTTTQEMTNNIARLIDGTFVRSSGDVAKITELLTNELEIQKNALRKKMPQQSASTSPGIPEEPIESGGYNY